MELPRSFEKREELMNLAGVETTPCMLVLPPVSGGPVEGWGVSGLKKIRDVLECGIRAPLAPLHTDSATHACG